MKQTLALVALLAVAAITVLYVEKSTEVDAFKQWKQQFGESFEAGEQSYRRLIFERNVRIIESHNADKTQTYKKGINQFTAYTNEQLRSKFLSEMIVPTQVQAVAETGITNVPSDVDWTVQNKVNPIVFNQFLCIGGWAFSTTGAIQSSLLFKDPPSSVSLSAQQLIDCTMPLGNNGCSGGWPSTALHYVQSNGITTQSSYPFLRKNNGYCKIPYGEFRINGSTSFNGCNELGNGIANHPIAVTVDASSWFSYHIDVFNDCQSQSNINHAVLLVGIVGGNWKIKNSWSASWGMQGYMILAAGNSCGICNYSGVYPS